VLERPKLWVFAESDYVKAAAENSHQKTRSQVSKTKVAMNIITQAFDMAAAVEKFLTKAKRFYYLVMLFGYRCPKCSSSLMMVTEGMCRCKRCRYEFDPTIEFQRCLNCGGVAILRVRRYQCKKCGGDITSKFLFDGIVFDTEYFRQKMAESRQRKKEQKQRVQQMLAECHSGPLTLKAPDLNSVPGLVDALNGLTAGLDASVVLELKDKFDLGRYQEHIKSHLEIEPMDLRQIPPLAEDLRLDLIWKFIAAIFLDHAGLVEIYQQDDAIWVMKYDYHKGQGISDEIDEIDGFERPE
jgi:hypothetical protein